VQKTAESRYAKRVIRDLKGNILRDGRQVEFILVFPAIARHWKDSCEKF
jgi:hypothetical protein